MCAGHLNHQTGPRIQNEDHHVQANLDTAKATTHPIRNRNIVTAKLACFLNSLTPSLIRVVRRKKTERTNRKIGIAAATKAIILKIIFPLSFLLRRGRSWPCPTRPTPHLARASSRVYDGRRPYGSELGKGPVFTVSPPGDAAP